MNKEVYLKLIGVLVSIIGFILIGHFSSWFVSIGVFSVLWGSNIENETGRSKSDDEGT